MCLRQGENISLELIKESFSRSSKVGLLSLRNAVLSRLGKVSLNKLRQLGWVRQRYISQVKQIFPGSIRTS